VNVPVRPWRLPFATAILLALAIVAAPLPSLAGEARSTAPKPTPTITSSVTTILAAQKLATVAPAARAQEKATTDLGSKSFFRTPGGIITLVALGAGVGFALYSTSHDRVKSPAR
jgi:hypothetical protein